MDTIEDRTQSLCPICLKMLEATIVAGSRGVILDRTCPDHGPHRSVVSEDAKAYRRLLRMRRKVVKPTALSQEKLRGCPDDCGLCPSHEQHTCLCILEITARCVQACPICLADSQPRGSVMNPSTAESALRELVRLEGGPVPLQLSGGEPTTHPRLLSIVRKAAALGFGKIELDTNGQALGVRRNFARELKEAGLTGVYLQMDGLEPQISLQLRGSDDLERKLAAIANSREAGLQVVLSATIVPGVNDQCLWNLVTFAVDHRLTGINFQSVALSGRYPPHLREAKERFTLSHFLRELERQSNRQILASDLMPIACPDPRCGAISYLVVEDGRLTPLTRTVSNRRMATHAASLANWNTVLQSLRSSAPSGCGASSSPALTRVPGRVPHLDFFSIGFHGMMDRYDFDLKRAKRCCVHRLSPEGRLVPFCLYNVKYRHGREGVPFRQATGH